MENYNAKDCGILLNEPLTIGDLVKNGKQFEIDSNFPDYSTDELFCEADDEPIDTEMVFYSPWNESFSELKSQMNKLSEDLYKKVVSPGTGEVCPTNSRVTIDYNAFWEKKKEAFDSTYLRGQASTFICGDSAVLAGLDEAVQTMRRGEEAQFLISYKLLYGELGCLPRIPAKADGLFIIKLQSFSEIGDIDAIEKIPAEERNDFTAVYQKAEEVIKNGKVMFQKGDIGTAIKAFHKSAESLSLCRLKDEEEQVRQVEMLLRLYRNMAICYNKQNLPAKACLMCKEIRRLCDISNNCKALFQEGRALLKLGEFGRARQALTRCQQLEPRNNEVSKELKLLAVKSENYDRERRAFSQRAMQNIRLSEDSLVRLPKPEEDFAKVIIQQLYNFKNSNNDRLELPDGFSPEEIELIQCMLVGELSCIEFKILTIGDQKMHTLVKKARC